MGGFSFQGPNYIICSHPSKKRCRCAGYRTEIGEDIEKMLVEREDKVLPISDLPQAIQNEMLKYHIGDTLQYEVKIKIKPTPLESFSFGSTASWGAPMAFE